MFAHTNALTPAHWLNRLLSNREALNTALAGLLLVALVLGMSAKAQAEEVVDELGAYDREMLTSLIEAVIAVDEGDIITTAGIPDASAPASSPRSIIPARRTDVVAAALGTPTTTAAAVDPGFALQLGSFASAENAQRGFEQANTEFGNTLASNTLYVQPIDLGERGVFHRLRIGGFENMTQASAACTTLGIAAADCMIVSASMQ
ncbi:MAG: SPOR domain-containing protein [Candidatus Phaeomarinobacter sp.]